MCADAVAGMFSVQEHKHADFSKDLASSIPLHVNYSYYASLPCLPAVFITSPFLLQVVSEEATGEDTEHSFQETESSAVYALR